MEKKAIEFLFPIFETVSDLPWLVKLLAFAVSVTLLVIGLKKYKNRKHCRKNGKKWKKKNYDALSMAFYSTIFLFILMGMRIFVFGGDDYAFMSVQVKPFDDSFVYSDLSTWDPGLKALIIAMYISLALTVLQVLAGGWSAALVFVGLHASCLFLFDFILTKADFLVFGIFGLVPRLYLFGGAVLCLALLVSNFLPDVVHGARPASNPYTPVYGGGEPHESSFANLLRMPSVIRDQYGNLYTRQYVDADGTYAEYAGNYTVVTIYAEDVNMFSATAGGDYFTW